MAITPLRIPNLNAANAIVDEKGRPTPEFLRRLNDIFQAIATTLNAITALPEIQQALLALDTATQAAIDAAAAAQSAADGAQGQTDAQARETSLRASYVTGLTLTASDAGIDVTIDISNHTRVYGDGTSVAVTGDTLTGQPYASTVRIYYDDPTRAGGAVAYQTTLDPDVAVQTGDRHSVGAINTPAAADPDTTGSPIRPPGYVNAGDIL